MRGEGVRLLDTAKDYLRSAVREHEVPALVLSFVYFFCVLAAY
jgi:hypothetical protein